MHNKNTDLNALNGLAVVYNAIDLKNIGRLTSTEDALDLAIKVFRHIENNIEPTKVDNPGKEDGSEKSDESESSNEKESLGFANYVIENCDD